MKFNFNHQRFEFTLPKIIPLISFLIALAILLGLTSWQLKRLVWKNNLINERINKYESEPSDLDKIIAPQDEEFRKVLVKGKLIND